MITLKNNINNLENLISLDKKIILYGAGASCELILKSYYKMLKDHLLFVVDSKDSLDNTCIEISATEQVPVISLKHFLRDWDNVKEQFVFLMTPYTSLHIIPSLDAIPELDGVEVYLFSMIVNKKSPVAFSFKSEEKPCIPKIIHYIWFGNGEIPEEDQRNIESWKRFCPDYEIKLWTEENYDCSKNRYCYEALQNRKYMYASDYARKDILYQCGGIYLDTDVELIAPLDELLYNQAFIGLEDGAQINSGSGMGAVPRHPMMKKMLDQYENMQFVNPDGSLNNRFNTYYETSLFLDEGFQMKNEYQCVNGMICFPREVFMPESVIGLYDTYTEFTVSNHKINPYDKTPRRLVLARAEE